MYFCIFAKNIFMKMKKLCSLCKRDIADKTNSHIIPSFLVCKIASSDRSGKRNHELVYSIGETIRAYAGNEVPMSIMERNFDDLSDERISEELMDNTCSKDYVFCSSCEKAIANYLESPYASRKKTDPQTAYYFWLSVLWRVNYFEILSFSMPKFILSEFRKSLYNYLQGKKTGLMKEQIQKKYPFNYRIIYCKDYSIDGDGCIYGEYDKSNRIFCITLGDLILCFTFKNHNIPDDFIFWGLEKEFKDAPLNDGKKEEEVKEVSHDIFAMFYGNLLNQVQSFYLKKEKVRICRFWDKLIELNCIMPAPIPSDLFIHRCMELIHDENKKIGERHTYRNFAISFRVALNEIYGIKLLYRKK